MAFQIPGNFLGQAKSFLPNFSTTPTVENPPESGNILQSAVKGANNTLLGLFNTGANVLKAPATLVKGAVQTTGNTLDATVTGVNDTLHNLFGTGTNVLQAPGTLVKGAVDTSGSALDKTVTGAKNTLNNLFGAGTNVLQAPGQALNGAVPTSGNVLDATVTSANDTLHNIVNAGANILTQAEVLKNGISGILGNKPNLIVEINQIRALSANQTEVRIVVQEKGVTGISRKIPASDLANFLNQPMPKQQLSTVMVTSITPYVTPSKAELEEYLKHPPS
uniref:Perilipin-4-like n=1 Tax=Diabrotica virgifera virgifera TaxID=50390 RepID=A0A6P7G0U4_DIAVI